MKRWIILAAIAVTIAPAAAAQKRKTNPDFERLRSALVEELAQAPAQEAEARNIAGAIRPDGTWPGIDYADTARTAFRHTVHLANMLRMCRAWKNPNSTLRGDKNLRRAINLALDHWLRRDYLSENWWNNEIGTPNDLTTLLFIMDNDLSPQQIRLASAIAARAHINAWGARQSGDRIKIAGIQAKNALFSRNTAEFEMLMKVIESEIRIVPFEQRGLMSDMSFHHRDDKVNNTLSYGLGYAEAFVEWAEKTSGTRYAFNDAQIRLLIDYYLDGICKMMIHGKINDPGTANRDIARQGQGRPASPAIPQRLLKISSYRKDELQHIANIRKGLDKPRDEFATFFWQSEHLAVQRAGWYASVRMFSTRNKNMEEPYNGEGLRNHYRADGANYLSITGTEYYPVTPAYDWQKIPGATTARRPDFPPETEIQKWGYTTFAGAATNGRYAAAGFDFISPHNPIRAKKSWFFFDREYVCLGAAIQAETNLPVATTLNQCALDGPVTIGSAATTETLRETEAERLVNAGDWIRHGGVGYIFLQPAEAAVSQQPQTGGWFNINRQTASPKDTLAMNIFKLWINHRNGPSQTSYAWMVIPSASIEEISRAAAAPKVEIISNTPHLQAVIHSELEILQAVFYRHGQISIPGLALKLHSPAIVVASLAGPAIGLAIADPTRSQSSITAEVNGQTITVELPTGEYAGKSAEIIINR
jgi:chondroitin AC lyase